MPESINFKSVKVYFPRFRQYFTALTVSFGMFISGLVSGWTGNNTDTLLAGKYNDIPITFTDLGWITSLPILAAMIVFFPVGILCDAIGRKPTLLFVSVCAIIGWILIIFSKTLTLLLIGRFVVGIGSGSFFLFVAIYNVEIAEKDIRAKLVSFGRVLLNSGILFSFIMSYITTMQIFTIICAVTSALFFIATLFQDETPTFKIKKNDYEGAKKILLRLRRESHDVDGELDEIKKNLNQSNQQALKGALRKRSTKIASIVSYGINFFQYLGGASVILLYTNEIFSSAQGSLDPKHSTIILGAIQVVTALIASSIIEYFHRRTLLVTSFIFTSVGLLILGSYFTLRDRHLATTELLYTLGFMPLLGLTIFTLMSAIGITPIPMILAAELYPTEIKGVALSLFGVYTWLIVFLTSRFYGDLKVAVGSDVTFYIFAGMCFSGSVFSYAVVPETKNKSLQQIQDEINKNKL
ncbi:hypothetical protein FQR65_LT05749 [Abscondita terminalis]|nr:hypothetical protein FQR65_LT05749 [Abscondita terminalis]